MDVKTFTEQDKKNRRLLQGSLKLFGISQRELAKKIGVHETYISLMFSGEREAKEKFKSIVKILSKIGGKNGRRLGTHQF